MTISIVVLFIQFSIFNLVLEWKLKQFFLFDNFGICLAEGVKSQYKQVETESQSKTLIFMISTVWVTGTLGSTWKSWRQQVDAIKWPKTGLVKRDTIFTAHFTHHSSLKGKTRFIN